ncbi:hypothetical protein MFKK_33430 [Halopseudomonas aestusnigri]|uniref:glycosyltransferase family 4 protein n=1 Tax=Halopseudomonas TaxID=2901189 RepID=UPI0022B6468C|nr:MULTISPECIES: glycosyltransferase [Halopseudomonas]BDX20533.1 hypothetical protein MFKK_33430 [Halopseudomonas aestusnigri]
MKVKALFAHDHYFYVSGESVYSRGGLPSSAWDRYLEHFSELVVLGRKGKEVKIQSKMTLSSCPRVSFELLPNLSRLRFMVFGSSVVSEKIYLAVRGVDVVVVRLPSRVGMVVLKEAIRQKKPYVIELVGCTFDSYWHHGGLKAKVMAFWDFFAVKARVLSARYVIYVTEHYLQQRYPNRSGVSISCSNVNVAELEFDPALALSRTKRGRVKIGLIGNYDAAYKGIDVAIRALHNVVRAGYDVVLQIVGSGDSSRYQKLVADLGMSSHVVFLGRLSAGTEIFRWLESVDIYIQPSMTEGLPRALIEAMSVGCPCIGSRVGGIPELLGERYLFNSGDYVALKNLLIAMIDNEDYRVSSCKENYVRSLDFVSDKLARRRSAFFKNMLSDISICNADF